MPKGARGDLGYCDYDRQILFLSARQTEAQLFSSFSHEYFHAKNPDIVLDEDLNEEIILKFEQSFMVLWVSI